MIAPRDDDEPITDETISPDLPRETVVSIHGIKVPVRTALLIRNSPYWTVRVAEHNCFGQYPSPMIFNESCYGLYCSAYEFLVYVGLLQAEDQMHRAMTGQPFDSFLSFLPADFSLPSAKTLNSVSRMAAYFGRDDLVREVQNVVEQPFVEQPSSSPQITPSHSHDGLFHAGTMQPFSGDNNVNVGYPRDETSTPPYYQYSDNDNNATHGQGPSMTETEPEPVTEPEITYLPNGRVVLPPMLSPLPSSFYGSSPELPSQLELRHRPTAPTRRGPALEEYFYSVPPDQRRREQQEEEEEERRQQQSYEQAQTAESAVDSSEAERQRDRLSRILSQPPYRRWHYIGNVRTERRHHPYRRSSRESQPRTTSHSGKDGRETDELWDEH
ncbi:hypothetical protein Sste5344_003635 [Sporothrix stenoceras]